VTLLSLDDLVAQVHGRPARAGSTRVVAIDGPAGSGKSTLAASLATKLDAPVVHMDDLYPGWDGLAAAAPLLHEWVIEPLAQARPVRFQRYDWSLDTYGDWLHVPRSDVLVVEGCGCGSRIIAPHLTMLLWVEAPREVRFARGIERDGVALQPLWERWARQEEDLFAAELTRQRADYRIDGAAPNAGLSSERHAVLLD
jgi:uridine kinase